MMALIVGCAGGAAFRDVVFPARAAVGVPKYTYKVLDQAEVFQVAMARGGVSGDNRELMQSIVNRYGQGGWRFVGQTGGCDGGRTWMIFEAPQNATELQPSADVPSSPPAP